MSIQELLRDIKGFWGRSDNLLALLIVVVASASFGLGRLSVAPVSSDLPARVGAAQAAAGETISQKGDTEMEADIAPVEGGYVASKNGTKYHLPWCGSAQQIKEENKVWFATKAEAEAAGYTAAANCKGI